MRTESLSEIVDAALKKNSPRMADNVRSHAPKGTPMSNGPSPSSVQQGDAEQVSVLHGEAATYKTIFNDAQTHCAKYGKRATVQGRFSPNETLFVCR